MTNLVLTPERHKFVLIDGNAILHRAYHAMPDLTNYKGDHIGALHGMVSMLLKITADLKPTHIAFCFDEKGENFRHKLLKKYQENRKETEKELQWQLDHAKEVVESMGIPTYSHNGFEADYLLGTIVEMVSRKKLEVESENLDEIVVVTGDRDLLQLVDDRKNVSLYMPIAGLLNAKLYHEKDVVERMGVKPEQIVSLKALIGDGSDNYTGVRGIGPKTAEKLIKEYGTFEEIYKHLDEIAETTKKKLEEGKEDGELSFKLATIVRDCDIDFDEEKAKAWDIDRPEAIKKFEEVGFKSLIERVKKVGQELDQQNQGMLF
jgi:DNA polymerase I